MSFEISIIISSPVFVDRILKRGWQIGWGGCVSFERWKFHALKTTRTKGVKDLYGRYQSVDLCTFARDREFSEIFPTRRIHFPAGRGELLVARRFSQDVLSFFFCRFSFLNLFLKAIKCFHTKRSFKTQTCTRTRAHFPNTPKNGNGKSDKNCTIY